MQSCLQCKLHIHRLQNQALQLINAQKQLHSLNDTLTSALNDRSALNQEEQLWKAKY